MFGHDERWEMHYLRVYSLMSTQGLLINVTLRAPLAITWVKLIFGKVSGKIPFNISGAILAKDIF